MLTAESRAGRYALVDRLDDHRLAFRVAARRQTFEVQRRRLILDHPLQLNVGRLSRYSEEWYAVFSSLGVCNRAMNNRFYSIDVFVELFASATGIAADKADLTRNAERAWNLYRLINTREGFSRKDDSVPEGWFEPLETREGKKEIFDYFRNKVMQPADVEAFLDEYYDERGWDKATGAPTAEKLEQLNLTE